MASRSGYMASRSGYMAQPSVMDPLTAVIDTRTVKRAVRVSACSWSTCVRQVGGREGAPRVCTPLGPPY